MKGQRLIIAIGMVILLPMLMAYSLIGEAFHEVAGSIMLALFIVHHILKRRGYSALFRGKYISLRLLFFYLKPKCFCGTFDHVLC